MGVAFGFKIPMYQGYNIDITIIKYMQVNTSFNTELMNLQVKLNILKNLVNHVYNICKPYIYIYIKLALI